MVVATGAAQRRSFRFAARAFTAPGAGIQRRQELPQLAEPRLIPPPALHRRRVDGLARLPHAGGSHGPLIPFGSETTVVPLESDEGDKPARFGLAVCDKRFSYCTSVKRSFGSTLRQ